MRALERFLLLQIIDQRWREHLHDMDYLREGIHLRGVAQLDPLVAYKNEAFTLFGDLMNIVWLDFARMIYHVQVTVQEDPAAAASRRRCRPAHRARRRVRRPAAAASATPVGAHRAGAQALAAAAAGASRRRSPTPAGARRPRRSCSSATPTNEPGRNDPCWCGSGKKYKKCHGA